MAAVKGDKANRRHELRMMRKKEKEEKLLEEELVQKKIDERFMKEAVKQAAKAAAISEVPIGCVIVYDGKIIARGYNRRNTDHSTLAHAEIAAIRKASKKINDWRLEDCTLYVTLEPCPMCAAALNWSQIGRVVYGCADPKRGASKFSPSLYHPKTEVTGGILEKECSRVMTDFFSAKRKLK